MQRMDRILDGPNEKLWAMAGKILTAMHGQDQALMANAIRATALEQRAAQSAPQVTINVLGSVEAYAKLFQQPATQDPAQLTP
jgi:hypothetical protein